MATKKGTKFSEYVYTTACPGCGFGCGVYLRELYPKGENHILSIDYRKTSPVNEGKLCRFGVTLADYYENAEFCLNDCFDDEIESVQKEAILRAADVLKDVKSSEIALISVGNTTNEEHMAFMKMGELLDAPVNTGVNNIYKDIGKLHVYTAAETTYEDIEHAKTIYLFINPYISYPLLTRRLVHAKRNGARIVYMGLKKIPIACENIKVKPCTSLYEVSEFCPDSESVIISDITPYTNSKRLAEIIEISKLNETGAKLLFMKPFVNSAGAGHLSRHTRQKSFEQIINEIKNGSIRVLFFLETDLINICLNPEIKDVLKNVETLIVMSSVKSPVCDIADILIQTEPFYKKEGTITNSEGRIISLSACTGKTLKTGFYAICEIIKALGQKPETFEDIQKTVFEEFKIEAPDEFKIVKPDVKKYDDVKKMSEKLEVCCPADAPETNAKFIYEMNPFIWHGRRDNNDYIELSPEFIQEQKLLKGYTADITCACGNIVKTTRFKPSDVEPGYIFSQKKQPFAKAPVAKVKIEMTHVHKNEEEKRE